MITMTSQKLHPMVFLVFLIVYSTPEGSTITDIMERLRKIGFERRHQTVSSHVEKLKGLKLISHEKQKYYLDKEFVFKLFPEFNEDEKVAITEILMDDFFRMISSPEIVIKAGIFRDLFESTKEIKKEKVGLSEFFLIELYNYRRIPNESDIKSMELIVSATVLDTMNEERKKSLENETRRIFDSSKDLLTPKDLQDLARYFIEKILKNQNILNGVFSKYNITKLQRLKKS